MSVFLCMQRLHSLSLFVVLMCLVGLRVGVCGDDVDCGLRNRKRFCEGPAVDRVIILRGAMGCRLGWHGGRAVMMGFLLQQGLNIRVLQSTISVAYCETGDQRDIG